MNDYESFFSFLEKNQPYFNMDDILVVSHLDTDGVTSLSLFKKFYEDKNPHLKIIQQLDDECIDEISNMPQKNVIILDSGSLKLNSIKKKLSNKNRVIIIDHHEIEDDCQLPENIIFINPFLFGINGSKEISTAGISYLILKELKLLSIKPCAK